MATASSTSTSPPRIKVKKELCTDNETIKELAETAMNDILGWYGYDSVDRLEVASGSASSTIETSEGVTGRLRPDNDHNSLPSGTSSSSSVVVSNTKRIESKATCPQTAVSQQQVIHLHSRAIGDHFLTQDDPDHPPVASASSSTERRTGRDAASATATIGQPGSPPNDATATRNGIVLHHQAHPQQHHLGLGAQGGGGGGGGESSTSEKDSSRESSKSPMLMKMLDKQEQTCQWCRKVIPSHQPGILGTTEGMIFCTEACFSQSRRASFKRAKTCDWCRHVRHAVSYVDFQDGASQLQFCSDKCLNQYKMQIFCNETQAHLELNPHLKEKSSSAGSLITPELWMKNCKSCSMSPVSDRSESVSPVPSVAIRSSPEPSPGIMLQSPTPAKKPLISVAPPSKLLSKSLQSALNRPSSKSARKRRSTIHRPSAGQQSGSVSSKRSLSSQHQADYTLTSGSGTNNLGGGSSSGSNLNNNNVTIPNNNLSVSSSAAIQSKPCTVTSSNVQDLRMLQKKHISPGGFDGRDANVIGSLVPPPPPPPPLNIPPQFLPPPLNLLRPPFFHMNPAHLRFNSGLANAPNLVQPQPQPPPPQASAQMGPPPSPLPGVPLGHTNRPPPLPNLLGMGSPPPVTILVPYPIIVPLPLPIPVPIPVIDFLRAALPKEPKEATQPAEDGGSKIDDLSGQEQLDLDTPLDFTLTSAGKLHERDSLERSNIERAYEQGVKIINYPCPSDETLAYKLSSVRSDPNEEENGLSSVKGGGESSKQLIPKIKIFRQETTCVGNESNETTSLAGNIRQPMDIDEEDIERERKEMVDRSRPLRKRKRVVGQQHLEAKPSVSETASEGMVDEHVEKGSTGGLGTPQET
ncbi:sine oculis-binding protein homolog A [Anopheles ziemanni]|uniref:sine oculis-binding protein homolog A n=1 Tax=Anopheles coustani TaxID=139045 RepID=UPI00265A9C5F|nr:sine oculis-binding protein homolog A [Anopheles coustani]XP_058170788.1 sine oculis-binding protein homolog A [Anopheles ziemanni]